MARLIGLTILLASVSAPAAEPRKTEVSIVGDAFHINGQPTYAGRTWNGHKIEGLLLNSRMVQGIFDDLNPETRQPVGLSRHRQVGRRAQHARVHRRDARVARSTACWRSRSTCKAAARRATRRTSPGTTRRSRRRRAAARLHGPAGADPRPRRRTGHGRDPRHLLLRPGPAAGGRSGRDAGRGQRGRLGLGPRLPQRADRDQQRVQRPLRPRDPEARPRPRADRARQDAQRRRAGGCS